MAYRWGGPPGGSIGWGGASTGGGGQTPVGIPYTFDDGTSAAGISNGQIRFNNATAGSITAIYISQTDGGAYPTDQGAVLATLSAGGLLYVNTASDDGVVAVFKVTACADSGTYYTLTGTYLSGVLPNDGAAVRVTIAPVEVTGVKRYVALLSQSGTDAPVATVLENSLGGTVVWTRGGSGDYRATLTGAFPDGKTIATPFEFSTTSDGPFYFVRTSDNELNLYNNGGTEYSAVLSLAIPITITVYP